MTEKRFVYFFVSVPVSGNEKFLSCLKLNFLLNPLNPTKCLNRFFGKKHEQKFFIKKLFTKKKGWDDGETEKMTEANEKIEKDMIYYCTYPKGYISQRVFVCQTCNAMNNNDTNYVGICYACKNSCHAGHKILDIWTKDHFRCDCGYRGNLTKCVWNAFGKKNDENKRVYNHNFIGKYCHCEKLFIEEENKNENGNEEEKKENNLIKGNDDLEILWVQCYYCQDWFHCNKCVGALPENGDFICKNCCSTSCQFLLPYRYSPDNNGNDNANNKYKKFCVNEMKEGTNNIGNIEKGISLISNWKDYLCKCKECILFYQKNQCYDILQSFNNNSNHDNNSNDSAIEIHDQWLNYGLESFMKEMRKNLLSLKR
ncbi:hypothetical protein RFI_18916 [Reticulomyxa filosa]|uniref:UBR-type domain-containing protein n=1 Tax=Reticulomyxa filosa TaxID=46433 RepID=X6MXL3_RETFI|nr:hypothetical protein RFI_18916 [Reticulomyxa filosa]|eukprot:ETO18356.1 hypothetical protein RFI_18916 [Reticulomyxa filosa]